MFGIAGDGEKFMSRSWKLGRLNKVKKVGERFRMGDTCTPMADSCQCMAKPLQYCKVISLQLKKQNKRKQAVVSYTN